MAKCPECGCHFDVYPDEPPDHCPACGHEEPADREDWPVHQPVAPDAPIPGRHWYGGCEPADYDYELGRYVGPGPRVNPATGICEGCGEKACPECGAGFYPDGICQCVPKGQLTFEEARRGN